MLLDGKQEDGTLTTHYCKQRWCIVCNRIRMGRRINDYGPVFEQLTFVVGITLEHFLIDQRLDR